MEKEGVYVSFFKPPFQARSLGFVSKEDRDILLQIIRASILSTKQVI